MQNKKNTFAFENLNKKKHPWTQMSWNKKVSLKPSKQTINLHLISFFRKKIDSLLFF